MLAAHSRGLAGELGVAEYLTKPVSQQRIANSVRRWLSRGGDVLVVEDDPDLAGLRGKMVQAISPHYSVMLATDGAEALQLLHDWRSDIVLLDLLMPQVSGYDVLKALQADARLRDVPVLLVITARGMWEEAVRAEMLWLARSDGLSVGEITGCLRSSMDVLVGVSR